MSIDRRSGAPSAFTWLLGLALGAACAATVACSATSGSSQGGLPQSGGGPLGSSGSGGSGGGSSNAASSGGTSSGASSGGTSSGASGSGSGGMGDAGTADPDAGGGGEGGGGGDGGGLPDGAPSDGASDAAGDGAVPAFTFTLIDTTITGIVQGSPVAGFDPIAEGSTINQLTAGTALSIRANVGPTGVGSVAFALDATYTHTENTAPYVLCGDDGAGTITSCANVLTVGKHTLTATPYSAASLGGTPGTPASVDFLIVDVADAGGQ